MAPETLPPDAEPLAWSAWAASKNAKAQARNRTRAVVPFDARGPAGTTADGAELISFAGNDYLGLSSHPEVIAAAKAALDRWGSGATASRLVTGTKPVHADLETMLATWKSTEAAVVFPTGYMANLGVLSTLAGPRALICSDAANHASIIDGCRLASAAGAQVHTYPHLDLDAVSGLLAANAGRAIVVSDSVFSMEGDVAPVDQLAQLCDRYGALLVLDEAHAVLGPHFEELPCEVLRVGTLSKTLGSLGGFVAGPRVMTELLVNRCRPFIYTTALSPADAAAALAALSVLRSAEGDALVGRLRRLCLRAKRGRPALSPIFPIIVGTEQAALDAAAALSKRGLLVPAIRPPTVRPGTSRLRVTLSAAHSDEDVDLLLRCLGELGLAP